MNPAERLRFIEALADTRLEAFQPQLLQRVDDKYARPGHGNFKEWQRIITTLPDVTPSLLGLDRDAPVFGHQNDCTPRQRQLLRDKLKMLCPWRKGPFNVFGIDIDAEWRSDRKWARVAPHVKDLVGKTVLDVGCSNGYYALRMQAMGAKIIIGIEPTWLYVFQFLALQKYLSHSQHAFVLPLALEEIPQHATGFDTAFSMGVLYHRKEPKEHLDRLCALLQAGGQLILETLIIEDKDTDVLIPNGCYANMCNAWIIPGYPMLENWLQESGFTDIRLIDVTPTKVTEQRRTEWMIGHSLAEALDPHHPHLTREGYPAPVRASVIAEKPL